MHHLTFAEHFSIFFFLLTERKIFSARVGVLYTMGKDVHITPRKIINDASDFMKEYHEMLFNCPRLEIRHKRISLF